MNVLILEDDISAALDVELILSEIGDLEIFRATTITAAQEYMFSTQFDLIIADIILDNNVNSLTWLKDAATEIPLIIITNNYTNEYYQDSLGLSAQAYLMKPINEVSLKFEIERIFQNAKETQSPRRKVMIKDGKKFHFIDPMEVIWVLTEGNYSTIKTLTKRIIIKTSLSKIIQALDNNLLFKTHRSALVGIKKIDHVDLSSNSVTMIDGTSIPIGKTYRSSFSKALAEHYDQPL